MLVSKRYGVNRFKMYILRGDGVLMDKMTAVALLTRVRVVEQSIY